MPIGSAAQPVVIRLADHFDGGGSPLTYSVTTDNGFAAATIDPAGLLTIKASSAVQPGFTVVSDKLIVRAASATNASDFREATFTVYQKTPTRFANAMVAVSGADARLTQTEVEVGSGWSGSPGVAWQHIVAGDFDGNGSADLAGRNPLTGRWRVFTSEGDRFAAGRVFGTWTPDVAWADATIGDFNADGRSDLLGRNPATGEWLVSRSTGTAFTTSTFRGFANPQNWGSFVAGDFTFDGKTDIAGRNQLTGAWRVLQGNGTQFDRPRRIGSWPTTTTSPTVLPLRVPFISRRLSDPFGSGSLGGFSGGSLAALPTWTTPSQGTSTSVPSTPNQGSSSGTLQITPNPAPTNGGSLVPNQPPTSGVTSGVSSGTFTLVPSGTLVLSGTGSLSGT